MRGCLGTFSALLLALPIASLHAGIIHVPADSTTIQGGINGAVNEDTVMVAPGTYYEHDIDFLGKAITVMGTDPEDLAVVAATVVDASSLGRVFYFHSGEDTTSVLAGLTITHGYSYDGGGLYCISSSPKILKNNITGNTADFHGGGIHCEGSSPIIRGNTICENYSISGGGLICYIGSSPIITCNVIADNISGGTGGGMVCWINSHAIIVNNIISRNTAISGGGIFCGDQSSPTFISNTIVENTATADWFGDGGGGIYVDRYGSPLLVNNILWNNVSLEGKEIFLWTNSSATISYSDVESGLGSVYVGPGSIINWGIGNIDEIPIFIDQPNSDFHLHETSPCVDTGDPAIVDACLPPGLGEDRSDMGAYGGEENCGWPPYNHTPIITSIPDTVAVAGSVYLYYVEANDPDGDTLHFSLPIAPHWLSIDSNSGVISGIPPMSAVGDTTVTVLVEDGVGGSDDQTYLLSVVPQVDLTITPDGPTSVPVGDILYFSTHIQNNREQRIEGDFWLTVRLPNSNELLIPEGLLNYPNPLHGQIFSFGSVDLSNELWVHPRASVGSYQLIGRIGTYPNGIFDESSFGFQIVE